MIYINMFLYFREVKLGKEHDIATNKLKEWKRKFLERLMDTKKQVTDFKSKDRMSEAENYVLLLEEITQKLEDFSQEVWNYSTISPLLCVSR
jgi:fructose-1,6-bisphosphatase